MLAVLLAGVIVAGVVSFVLADPRGAARQDAGRLAGRMMTWTRSHVGSCAALTARRARSLCPRAQAQDWNQWRGRRRDGVVAELHAAGGLARAARSRCWKVIRRASVTRPRWSPADRVYLFSRVGEQEVLTAYDVATGKQVWREGYDAPYQMNPAATRPRQGAEVDAGRRLAAGSSRSASAASCSAVRRRRRGKVLWRHDFGKEFGAAACRTSARRCRRSSTATTVIAHVGGTGAARSSPSTARPGRAVDLEGDGPAYASPIIATFGGTRSAHHADASARSVWTLAG